MNRSGATNGSIGRSTRVLLMSALVLSTGVAVAEPQPTGATAGVQFDSPAAGVTNITAPNHAIIDYASFNLASHETVNFIQPSSAARVLNRIHSATPTQIDGTITANGVVYLVNPAGVTFGAGSVVDAAGLFAAAGSLSNEDFLAGVNYFTQIDGAVSTHGIVRADTIAALIGREVINTGTIKVPNGTAILASGSSVLIGSPRGGLYVQVDVTPRTDNDGGVANDGVIEAKQVSLVTGDIYALALAGERTSGPGSLGVTISEADTDGDTDIDDTDIATATANYTGPGAPESGAKTQQQGDTDGDGDVDDADLGNLFALYTGPIIKPPPAPPLPPQIADASNLDDIARLPEVVTVVNLTEADLGILRDQLGIAPRTATARERIERVQDRALYNDLSPTFDRTLNPDGSISIANARLDADVVRQALAVYRERLEVQGVSPAERNAQIRASVQQAMQDYAKDAAEGEEFDADRFVDFVRQANPQLLDDLSALQTLRTLTLTMGLSEREKDNSSRVIIERAKPEGLSFEQMKATLESAGSLSLAQTQADAG